MHVCNSKSEKKVIDLYRLRRNRCNSNNNVDFNLDFYLNSDLSFTIASIPQTIYINKYNKYHTIALNRLLTQSKPCKNVHAIYHNLHGKWNYKLNNLNYVSSITENNKIDVVYATEHLTKKIESLAQPSNYQMHVKPPLITSNNGISNGTITLINNDSKINCTIARNESHLIQIEIMDPFITLCMGYATYGFNTIFNKVKSFFISTILANNIVLKPTICIADLNARFGKHTGDVKWNSKGMSLFDEFEQYDIIILNAKQCYGIPTFQSLILQDLTSIIDIVIVPKWVLQKYQIEMKILQINYGSDHFPIKLQIMSKLNEKDEHPLTNHLYYDQIKQCTAYILIPSHQYYLKKMDNVQRDKINSQIATLLIQLYNKMHDNFDYQLFKARSNKIIIKQYCKNKVLRIKLINYTQNKQYCTINNKQCNEMINQIVRELMECQNECKRLSSNKQIEENEFIQKLKQCTQKMARLNITLNQILSKVRIIDRIKFADRVLTKLVIKKDIKQFYELIKQNSTKINNTIPNALKNGNTKKLTKGVCETFNYFENLMKLKPPQMTSLISEYEDSFKYDLTETGQLLAVRPSILYVNEIFKLLAKNTVEALDLIDYNLYEWIINNKPILSWLMWQIFWKKEFLAVPESIVKLTGIPKPNGSVRGIGPTSINLKLYSTVMFKLVQNQLLSKILPNQTAYKPGVGTNDAIMAQIIIIKQNQIINKKPTIIASVDYRKAYPSMDIDQIFFVLYHMFGIKGKRWRILYHLATLLPTTVNLNGIFTPIIMRYAGVRQGDTPSGVYYNIIAQIMHEFAIKRQNGIEINVNDLKIIFNEIDQEFAMLDSMNQHEKQFYQCINECMHYLAYADDINIQTPSIDAMQQQFINLYHWNPIFKQVINDDKTKYIIFFANLLTQSDKIFQNSGIVCNGTVIKQTKCMKYLGIWFDSKLNFNENVKIKIGLSNGTLQKMNLEIHAIMNHDPILMLFILKSNVLPIIEAGMQAVQYTEKQNKVMFNKMCNQVCVIIGMNWKMSHFLLSLVTALEHTQWRNDLLQLLMFYDVINKTINVISKRLLVYDMVILFNCLKNEQAVKKILPDYKKLYSYYLFTKFEKLQLLQYFNTESVKTITRQQWKNIVIEQLQKYWNKRYYTKIQKSLFTVQQLCKQNELIIKDQSNILFKQSLFSKINDWIHFNVGIKFNQVKFHSQFWNLIFGAHHWNWTIQKLTKKNNKKCYRKKYIKCVICSQNWWEKDPLYHLLNQCDLVKLQFEGLKKFPMVKPEWIHKNSETNNENELIQELNNQIQQEFNSMECKWKNEFKIKHEKNSFKINKFYGLYDYNWLQLNFIIWTLDKDFQTSINSYNNELDGS